MGKKKISSRMIENSPKLNRKNLVQTKNTGIPLNENILFDISEFQFRSIKVENFTNFLKDSNEFRQYINDIFHDMIPEINNNSYNYHLITGEKLLLTKKILDGYGITLEDDEEENLLQFSSGTGGVRFIGRRLGNIFKLYFLDFYHLIYPSIKFNTPDYNKNNFCILRLKQ